MIKLVRTTIPGTDAMLSTVHIGYDAACAPGSGYYGFCQGNGALIIINLFAFYEKAGGDADVAEQQFLSFDLLATLTHEMAHALTPRGGHGNIWRHTHMDFLKGVFGNKLSEL